MKFYRYFFITMALASFLGVQESAHGLEAGNGLGLPSSLTGQDVMLKLEGQIKGVPREEFTLNMNSCEDAINSVRKHTFSEVTAYTGVSATGAGIGNFFLAKRRLAKLVESQASSLAQAEEFVKEIEKNPAGKGGFKEWISRKTAVTSVPFQKLLASFEAAFKKLGESIPSLNLGQNASGSTKGPGTYRELLSQLLEQSKRVAQLTEESSLNYWDKDLEKTYNENLKKAPGERAQAMENLAKEAQARRIQAAKDLLKAQKEMLVTSDKLKIELNRAITFSSSKISTARGVGKGGASKVSSVENPRQLGAKAVKPTRAAVGAGAVAAGTVAAVSVLADVGSTAYSIKEMIDTDVGADISIETILDSDVISRELCGAVLSSSGENQNKMSEILGTLLTAVGIDKKALFQIQQRNAPLKNQQNGAH